MALQSTEVQDFFRRLNIKPFSTGPYTPWSNRADAAVRVFKETLHDLCSQVGSSLELKHVTVRELLRKTAALRTSMVTYGGKTVVELVFGRKPRDIVTLDKTYPQNNCLHLFPR